MSKTHNKAASKKPQEKQTEATPLQTAAPVSKPHSWAAAVASKPARSSPSALPKPASSAQGPSVQPRAAPPKAAPPAGEEKFMHANSAIAQFLSKRHTETASRASPYRDSTSAGRASPVKQLRFSNKKLLNEFGKYLSKA